MYYFDHAASTPPHEEVIRTMAEVMAKHYANPSSLHRGGHEAGNLLERARSVIASVFRGTEPKEWIFTSGGTESNNIAITGAARASSKRGKHIITTAVEHPSVYDTCLALEREGFKVTILPVNSDGIVSIEVLEQALTDETILVSVMHVNNETGAVQPIREIGELLKQHRSTIFHVDGVQSVGKLPIDLQSCGIDLFSASAHKVNGPRGVGLLYVRAGVILEPLYHGGSQERGQRPGTENVAGIVAAAKAFRMALESQPERAERMYALRERLLACISEIPELIVNGVIDHSAGVAAPNIVNFSYPGMKPEVIVHMLEKHRVLASTKSACSSKSDDPSRVLLAMGASRERAASGIRISFGDEHGAAELEWLCRMLHMVVQKLKPLERKE
ncbi:cysteine desulfurase family protein [Paenibacillus sp. OV219]|uniref:cysteine desulfurase family protein n=1 Tax=Paenibacillus sp. OV219 TaxID=1884377 RepID=UPI0008B0E282|nr:cysteine desulfurase family protein [Paenibacillus sp. OV219]SEN10456.1 cysteine desulfurase [Paenibacillus sp. OV219]